SLIRLLSSPRFRIKLLEADRLLGQALLEEFPNISVLSIGMEDMSRLQEEHLEQSDWFVACSKKDEENLLACIQAKQLGIKNIYLLLHKIEYTGILKEMQLSLGLQGAASPHAIASKEVLQLISE